MATVGENIRKLREQSGLSQTELGKKVNKTRSCISQWENGKSYPRMGMVETLANIFNVPISQIIDSSVTYGFVNMPTYKDVHERELIDTFRTITPEGQRQLMIYARGIAATYKAEDD